MKIWGVGEGLSIMSVSMKKSNGYFWDKVWRRGEGRETKGIYGGQ